MKELSIFIDESGDWGEYDYKSPFYIVTMVVNLKTRLLLYPQKQKK